MPCMLVLCLNCKKEFYAKPYDVKVRGKKFCCRKCYSEKAGEINNSGRFYKGHERQGFNERNSNWKGNEVGYVALHNWVKRRKTRPEKCENCHKRKAIDLANRSNEYKRDLSDWWFICRKCHMELDGRMKIFLSSKRNAKS
jgi:hypothetical protein